ncbi:acyltransferase family protein [Acinetobacter oleivorans]|uniref:acyltransferase family protein n=1 Tax=Acinetobacter oleivorans TaxID=1148157 RepID=UPI001CD602E0|nr:acyltransferase [Acinetobacter oleivorans]
MLNIQYYLLTFFLIFFFFSLPIPIYNKNKIILKNQNSINGIRGLLASLVMFSHLFKDLTLYQGIKWKYDKDYYQIIGWGNQALNTGKIGVAIFFMISGYLFYQLLLKQEKQLNIKRFFYNRFTRIYPLYFFAILFCTSYLLLTAEYNLDFHLLKKILSWFLFLGPYDGLRIVDMTHGVEWTLKLEILLYISIPILFYIFSKIQNLYLRHFFIISSIIAIFIIGFILRVYGKVYIDPRAALCFYMGYIAIEIKNQKTKVLYSFFNGKFAALLSILLFISTFFISSHNFFYFYLIFSCGFLFISLACDNNLFGLLNAQPLQVMGEISYSIYLLHGIILYFFIALLNYFGVRNIYLLLILIPCYFYCVYTLSTITFLQIEKRFHK